MMAVEYKVISPHTPLLSHLIKMKRTISTPCVSPPSIHQITTLSLKPGELNPGDRRLLNLLIGIHTHIQLYKYLSKNHKKH